jgi:hypothetical protein
VSGASTGLVAAHAAAERDGVQALPARLITALFAGTLFTSASLIFIVEPMFGKLVLPRLGGAPAVWNTCMVFYQAVLLAGYLYAHALTTRCRIPGQVAIHLALLLAAGLMLPVGVGEDGWLEADASPVLSLLEQLVRGVGAPLFALSATAPLLQHWFSRTGGAGAKDPYFLYAASNVGSMLALLAYPLLIEPSTRLGEQQVSWALAYALFGGLTLACGLLTLRSRSELGSTQAVISSVHVAGPTWRVRCLWVALSAVPSSLMLGATTYISTDLGSAPLFWTIPLALYLLSFILAFSSRRASAAQVVLRAAIIFLPVLLLLLVVGASQPLLPLAAVHLLTLFLLSTALLTRLANVRPISEHLTEFYVWIALGGMTGGLFNSLGAPLLFDSVAEYPIALVAAAWLLPAVTSRTLTMPLTAAAVTAGVAAAILVYVFMTPTAPRLLMMVAVPALSITYLKASRTAVGLGLATTLVFCGGLLLKADTGRVLHAERTFFGVLRVEEQPSEGQRRLLHGTTIHGAQRLHEMPPEPLTYYHRGSPVGQVFRALDDRLDGAHVGAVGLGVGSLAAYARTGQSWRFFEIDPSVVRIARDRRYFTFLAQCGDICAVEVGDARLTLARGETPRFDLLVLDAFSSDAIPAHLLTVEALDVYLRRLADGGVMAFHISNRHFRLRPVLAALASQRGLAGRAQFSPMQSADSGQNASEWVVLARSDQDLGRLASDARWQPLTAREGVRVWTDDYSDLVGALGW